MSTLQSLFSFDYRPALAAAVVSLLVSVLLVLTQRWHGRFSMDSHEGIQKFHTLPTPRVGGIAVVAGVLLAYALAHPGRQALLGPLLLASAPAFAFGLLEDLTKHVSVLTRLLATMASGVLGWAITGQAITDANMPGLDWLLQFTLISVAFTAFAVGGVANAINIIDGFNGLAAGAVVIILTTFGYMAASLGDTDLARTCLFLAGAVVGFLLVNWPFGKLFLGDGGAYFLGFAVAWIAVLLLARHTEVSAWAPLLVCGLPIMEVVFSIVRRHRRKTSFGKPDRLHLHSLVKRRIARHLLPHGSRLARNSLAGAIMWSAVLLPALIARQWPTNTPALVTGLAVCALLYKALYTRMTQFRWCWKAATLRLVPPNQFQNSQAT